MKDKLKLLDTSVPLRTRYDKFVVWLSSKNHAIVEFMAQELGLTVSEVDVYNELGDLDDTEFDQIDNLKFDVGHLFIIVRAPKEVRAIMYDRHKEILTSQQPLTVLKAIVDENSDYTSMEELVKKISGNCWKSVSSYLRQRNIVSGTITTSIRRMLMQIGNKVNAGETFSEGQLQWLIRAIEHDHSNDMGIFTNDTIKTDFNDDYLIFVQIHAHIGKYAAH